MATRTRWCWSARSLPITSRNTRSRRRADRTDGPAEEYIMRITRILCPVDQSECSGKALRYAAALAHMHDAALDVVTVIINVIPPPVPELAMMPIFLSNELKIAAASAQHDFVNT